MDLLNKTENVEKNDPDYYTVKQMQALGEFFEMSLSWFDMCDACQRQRSKPSSKRAHLWAN